MRLSTSSRSITLSLRALLIPCTYAIPLNGVPTPLLAQDRSLPYETMELGLAVDHNFNKNTFHELYDPGLGITASVRTPFYLGTIGVGLHVFSSSGRRPENPDFVSQYIHLAWGYSIGLPGNLCWQAGVRAGLMRMAFDISDPGLRFESEVAFEAGTAIRYSPIPRWAIILSGRFRKVFTHERINLSFVGVGLSRTFATPRWLKALLQ